MVAAASNADDSLERRKIRCGRTMDHAAERVETRAVTGAIPALLGCVPGDDAAEVRANGGALVEHSVVVPVHRDLGDPAPDHRAGAAGDLVDGRDLPRRRQRRDLAGDVRSEERRGRKEWRFRWV